MAKAELAVPHRDIALPFEEYEMMEDGTVRVLCSFDERYTEGHFPGNPFVPGHWSMETTLLAAACALQGEAAGTPLLVSVDGVRWKKPIRPGEEVEIRAGITKSNRRIVEGLGTISVGGEEAVNVSSFKALIIN